jgi:hypothetical protein
VLSCIRNIKKKYPNFTVTSCLSGDQKIGTKCIQFTLVLLWAGNGKDNRLSYTDKILDIMKNIGRPFGATF